MTDLRDNYRYYRARAYRAEDALKRARADLEKGKKRYGACSRTISYEQRNAKGEGWLTNARTGELRTTWCDEAKEAHIDHTGWYTDPYQDGKMRGVVVQLSHNRYFPAYESDNDTGILVDWSDCRDNMRDAAYAADDFAKSHAEEELEYQTAWSAGSLFAQLGEEAARERTEILELCAEYRQARSLPGATEMTAICATIKASISLGLRNIAKAREQREKLREGNYGELCFYPSKRLIEAFNEGACL
jgi:hypothetical protein